MENQNEKPLKADELSAVTGGTYDPEPGDWQDYNRKCSKCDYSPIWVHDCQSKFPCPWSIECWCDGCGYHWNE